MKWSAHTHGFEATAPAPFTGHWAEVGNPPDYHIQYAGVPAADRAPSFHDRRPLVGEAQVLRTVAHELRSPLTALVTAAELMSQDFDDLGSDQKRELVASMHRGALWMHALVENLLCDASIREGRFHLNRSVASLADIVAEVEPVVVPLMKRRRQQLTFHNEIPVSDVIADPRRIGQVLVNFLSNASKYSPEDTPIETRLVPRGTYVRAEVLDRGPGISSGDETRLFETFYRTVLAHSSGQVGAGLGLSIAKTIVEAHAGRCGAENRPDGGACFWFELPTPAALGASGDEAEIEIGERRR